MTATEVEADLDVLTDLDFDPALPCEHTQHPTLHIPDGPAAWLAVTGATPCCGQEPCRYLICDAGRIDLLRHDMLRCNSCGARLPTSDTVRFFPLASVS